MNASISYSFNSLCKEARRQQKEELKRQKATRRKVSKGMEKKMQGDTMKVTLLRSMIDREKESNYGHAYID